MTKLRIATRKSQLALWQARHVAERLCSSHAGLDVELVPTTTTGDRIRDIPLAKVGGKGLFVKELERALLEGDADIAVHSMKDVPVALPAGLHIAVILAGDDPRDAFVSHEYPTLGHLPGGARVGTSSLRRKCQLRTMRSDLDLRDLRGNVDTRLRRLAAGDFDALILACAGLKRLHLESRITEAIEPDVVLPAIGQGAMGIECRCDDRRVHTVIAPLADVATTQRVAAERAMNAGLNGGCQLPVAGFAEHCGDRMRLRGLVASLDGRRVIRAEREGPAGGGEALGREVAAALRHQGAEEILAEVHGEG